MIRSMGIGCERESLDAIWESSLFAALRLTTLRAERLDAANELIQ